MYAKQPILQYLFNYLKLVVSSYINEISVEFWFRNIYFAVFSDVVEEFHIFIMLVILLHFCMVGSGPGRTFGLARPLYEF